MRKLNKHVAFVKFLIVGGLNTAFSYGIYALFIFVGLNYLLASALSFVISIIVSFKMHGKFVFSDRPNRSFYVYAFSWLVIYFVNACSLVLLVSHGMSSYVAGIVLIPPISVFAFLIMKYVAFKVEIPGKP